MDKKTVVESSIKLDDLKPIKSETVDLKQFNNKPVKIEKVSIIQVPSNFTPLKEGSSIDHIPQWVMKVESEVITSIGEGDTKIEFRCSELFNLIQDENGALKGYPQNDKSNLTKFLKDVGATNPSELVGKSSIAKAYEKEYLFDGKKTTRSFLKFKY